MLALYLLELMYQFHAKMYLRSLLKHVLRITHVITCILNVAFGQGLAGDTVSI